jgi:hypothetical protein
MGMFRPEEVGGIARRFRFAWTCGYVVSGVLLFVATPIPLYVMIGTDILANIANWIFFSGPE